MYMCLGRGGMKYFVQRTDLSVQGKTLDPELNAIIPSLL